MTRETAIQISCLYGPIVAVAILLWWVKPTKKLGTGLLYSTAWIAALLPWFDLLAVRIGLWAYAPQEFQIGNLPLALYLGWVIAWGIVAPLLAEALGKRRWAAIVILVVLDLCLMPEISPVLQLSDHWWVGEIAFTLFLLVPAVLLAQWTATPEKLLIRCAMLAPAFGGIFIGLPLLLLLQDLDGILSHWDSFSPASQVLFISGLAAFSLPGMTALRDFALSGKGTPVPLEPPKNLVTHGIYSYLKNPMQLSMTSLLLLESLFLASYWPGILALIGIVYSEGLARWSEMTDMRDRFGKHWDNYQRMHRSWVPTWRPRINDESELWFDDSCGSCGEVAYWLSKQSPRGLILRKASEWPGPPLRRMTWRNRSTGRTEAGVTAVAMALQHIHLGWATIGWLVTVPGISHTIQLCFDMSGAGKKV